MAVNSSTFIPRLFLISGVITGSCILIFSINQWDYYTLPVPERPLDLRHPILRSSGRNGLIFGIVGTGLMVLNLTYLIRKRLASVTWLGSFRNWMAFHVYSGIIGPALILLHSAYVLRSPLATLSAVAMGIVVLTGIMGRFIYAQVPRSLQGKELEIGEVHRQLSDSLRELRSLGVGEQFLGTILGKPTSGGTTQSLFATLIEVIRENRLIRREFRKLRKEILSSKEFQVQAKQILPLAKKLCQQRQWYSRYHQIQQLMGSWRFFHRWLALTMLLTVIFHIFVAIRYGDLWIFSKG